MRLEQWFHTIPLRLRSVFRRTTRRYVSACGLTAHLKLAPAQTSNITSNCAHLSVGIFSQNCYCTMPLPGIY
jgi:hypothetical protein